MTYKDRLLHTENIKKIFTDINKLHNTIHDVIDLDDEDKYIEIADIVYAKLSLIERELLSIRANL